MVLSLPLSQSLNNMIQIYQAKIDDVAALSELFDLYRIFYGKESNLIGANQFLTERIVKNETTIFLAKDIYTTLSFVFFNENATIIIVERFVCS